MIEMAERGQRPAVDLAGLLRECGVRPGARLLRIGTTSPAAESKLRSALRGFEGEQHAIEGDAFNASLPSGNDLAVVALPVAATPDVFEDFIYARLAPALTAGGIAFVQFCRDASDDALDALKIAGAAREALGKFLTANFGSRTIETLNPIAQRFATDGTFECMGWAARTKRDVLDEPIVWLVLRKRSAVRPTHRAIVRSLRPDRYSTAELAAFFRGLRNVGVDFLSTSGFAERLASHVIRPGPTPAFGLVKLDIHRNIQRPPEIATALRDAGVPGLFLMMHRHPFNEAFFDSDETWDILKSIRDDGHEVGLHLDPFHLIRTFGDVYAGVEAAVADFAKRRICLRAATLHGDTSSHVVARALKAWDFFREDQDRVSWDGKAPDGEAFLADHIGRYEYAELAARFGIDDMVEAHYCHRGKRVSPQPLVYVTDNSRSLQVTNVPSGTDTARFGVSEQFRIPVAFAAEAAPTLRAHPFLALFHPQWFW